VSQVTDVEQVKNVILRYRFSYRNEKELQEGLAMAFLEAAVPAVREYRLGPRDTIDFMIDGGIGVEVKVGGSLADATRQLHRYAGFDEVHSLVLVTTRSRLANMPMTLQGKPLGTLVLSGAFV
jgi:hypothetical protein